MPTATPARRRAHTRDVYPPPTARPLGQLTFLALRQEQLSGGRGAKWGARPPGSFLALRHPRAPAPERAVLAGSCCCMAVCSWKEFQNYHHSPILDILFLSACLGKLLFGCCLLPPPSPTCLLRTPSNPGHAIQPSCRVACIHPGPCIPGGLGGCPAFQEPKALAPDLVKTG